ncbi:hypothetical protein NQ318_020687 [Aromia moschata]|uniref:Uncharacterized protein n=1 Tax=Aromia moschata TaxID=1265417 RepID=A0AAV8XNW1_9CUCU|nr:hypothetical protein NQ318_020687 [Aromia moschata]
MSRPLSGNAGTVMLNRRIMSPCQHTIRASATPLLRPYNEPRRGQKTTMILQLQERRKRKKNKQKLLFSTSSNYSNEEKNPFTAPEKY